MLLALVTFVSELEKRQGTPACPRCKAGMREVLWIDPIHTEPELIAYECSCNYVISVLTPAGRRSRRQSW